MNVHPFYLPRRARREAAEDAGYTPDNDPVPTHLRAPDGTDRMAVFAAQVEAVRAENEKSWTT